MFASKTVKELRCECRARGVRGYSGVRRGGLVELLEAAVGGGGGGQPAVTVGVHVFKRGDMAASIGEARGVCPLDAIQIFTHGPRTMVRGVMDYAAVRGAAKGIRLYVHSSYPTNPWNGKRAVINHTLDQFRSSLELGARGVVLHIPKMGPDEVAAGVEGLVGELRRAGLMEGQRVILEMKAVRRHETKSYESPEKIDRLVEALVARGLGSGCVGICIDTAHIYAGGANIRTYEAGVRYLGALRHKGWVCLLHLNGNEYDAEKRAGDKHAIPLDGEDRVWRGVGYEGSGCRAFVEFARGHSIDYILEVKEHHTPRQIAAFVRKVGGA